MSDIQINMADLHRDLDSFVNLVNQGDDRIVLLKDGEPIVVIIGIDALKRLEQQSVIPLPSVHFDQVLKRADELRQRIQNWQEQHGGFIEDSVETRHKLREEHDESVHTSDTPIETHRVVHSQSDPSTSLRCASFRSG